MIDKRILIIGGSGALGQALVARYKEDNVVCVFSRDEHKQEDLKLKWPDVRCILGDVKDRESIDRALLSFQPDIVIQAAALKTVWTCQANPYESVKTNIIGHQNVIDAVEESPNPVQRLVFVSTDKACNPINVYGMCKAISEQLYVDFSKRQLDTKVHIVRYGNVMNSTRSIIPLFRRLIMEGQDYITITDMEMTRFLLTLDEAIATIDWSLDNPDKSEGNIVVPKVKAVKIVDMMRAIGEASGNPDIEFKKIPIRDGEKLHEEMISKFEFQRLLMHTFGPFSQNYYVIGQGRTTESYDAVPYRSDLHLAEGDELQALLNKVKDFAENG